MDTHRERPAWANAATVYSKYPNVLRVQSGLDFPTTVTVSRREQCARTSATAKENLVPSASTLLGETKNRDQYGNEFYLRNRVWDIQGQQGGRWAWDVFLRSQP